MGLLGDTLRTGEVFTQGIVKGLASGVAGIGDLAVGAGNFVTGNGFKMSNMADGAADAVTWTEPETDFERGAMAFGQGVGEVTSFVAVGIATGGVGGVVAGGSMAAVRGGSIAARAASSGARWAGNTAKALNPVDISTKLAKVGTGLEIYFTGDNILENYKDLKSIDNQETAEFLQTKADAILEEKQHMSEQLDALGNQLSAEQAEEFNNRFSELQESETLITRWLEGDLSEEEQLMARERLDKLLPTQEREIERSLDSQETSAPEQTQQQPTPETSSDVSSQQADTPSTRRDLETTQMSISEQFDQAVSGFFADSEVLASLNTLMAGVLGWVIDALGDLSSDFRSANDSVLANANDRLGMATPESAPAPDPAREVDEDITHRQQPGLNEATV